MRDTLMVGIGGFFGAMSRSALSSWVELFTQRSAFPFGTLAVNVLGCFVVGFLVQFGEARGFLNTPFRHFALIGFLGAFTTFSTFTHETMNLFFDGKGVAAAMNVAANVTVCAGALLAARALALWADAGAQ